PWGVTWNGAPSSTMNVVVGRPVNSAALWMYVAPKRRLKWSRKSRNPPTAGAAADGAGATPVSGARGGSTPGPYSDRQYSPMFTLDAGAGSGGAGAVCAKAGKATLLRLRAESKVLAVKTPDRKIRSTSLGNAPLALKRPWRGASLG